MVDPLRILCLDLSPKNSNSKKRGMDLLSIPNTISKLQKKTQSPYKPSGPPKDSLKSSELAKNLASATIENPLAKKKLRSSESPNILMLTIYPQTFFLLNQFLLLILLTSRFF